jgi:AraC-like DNA-binding protein
VSAKSSEQEHAQLWHVPALEDLLLLRATFVDYTFKRHTHDYFAIGMIEAGLQKFDYQRNTFFTPPQGIIVINPGEPHTGEAASVAGFKYRALYPDADAMRSIASEVTDSQQTIPFFTMPVIHNSSLYDLIRQLHIALEEPVNSLQTQSQYLMVMASLILQHADRKLSAYPIRPERNEVTRLRRYIETYYAEAITLDMLADLVHWNKYYLLRVFRATVGLPPHRYLESIRIQRSQDLLRHGMRIAEVALLTGFNSQSHFTTTFKRIIGVTPGHYAHQFNRSIF